MRYAVIHLVLILPVAACGTPKDVRELSADAGAAVLSIAKSSQQIASAAKQQAEGRVSTIDKLSRETLEQRLELEVQVAAARAAKHPAVELYEHVKQFTTEQEAVAQKLEANRAAAIEGASKSQSGLSVPTAEYKKVADDLAILAKAKDRWTRLKVSRQWLADLHDRLKEAESQAESAARGKTAGK